MITALLPKALRDFLPYISPAAFNLVSKSELISRLSQIARLCLNKEQTTHFRCAAKSYLSPDIKLVATLNHPIKELRSLDEKTRRQIGEVLLSLYFKQLYNPSGIFCDLRTSHFQLSDFAHAGAEEVVPILDWNPPPYWFYFQNDFREGLLDLYDGYYTHDAGRVDQAIFQLKLVPANATSEQLEMIRNVFQRHFGPGEDQKVLFSLAKFRNSFQDIFDVLIRMNHQIPVDFPYSEFTSLVFTGLWNKRGSAMMFRRFI